MNLQHLLQQFFGTQSANPEPNDPKAPASGQTNNGQSLLGNLSGGLAGGALGGLAAGGLIGIMLGSKKMRKMAGGVARIGGAAALGAVAFRAWQGWQNQHQPSAALGHAPATIANSNPVELFNLRQVATDGKPFELALIRAMISAAAADGHIGPDEQRAIFDRVGAFNLAADEKAIIFDAISKPDSAVTIATLANGLEQAAELWLAARMAIDPDDPREQLYLKELSAGLNLPQELQAHLESNFAEQHRNAA